MAPERIQPVDGTGSVGIQVTDIHKRYGATHALKGVTMEFVPGELTAICGENGAGKSTLMKILSGLERPTSGAVEVGGRPVHRFEPATLTQEYSVALVPQELSLCADRSVAHNILLGREPGGAFPNRREMTRVAKALLERLGSSISPDAPARSLDVASQQLVVIARALARDARVLILDEPTSVLSPVESERLFAIIEGLRNDGVTMIYVSHRMPEIFRLSDSIHVLRDGEHVASFRTRDAEPDQVVAAMVGRQLAGAIARAEKAQGSATSDGRLVLRDLSGRGFQEVSLTVRTGEIVGLAGLPDSGRTELLRAAFGAEDSTGDRVVDGDPLTEPGPVAAMRTGLGYLPGERRQQGIFPTMSVADNINVLTLREFSTAGLLNKSRMTQVADERATDLRVKTASVSQPITALSGGNQQKALLARWLTVQPKVLLLDDPTRGIDVAAKAEIYDLFERLTAGGTALLVSSSDLPELLTICDRILVMAAGRVVGELTPDQFSEERVMALATGAHNIKERE